MHVRGAFTASARRQQRPRLPDF
ncbi:hypothetical protein VTO73DRAFT_15125 [Trametes versicolor]